MAELITAADLGIDTTTDQGLFDWLLASILFGRPVPQKVAATAFHRFKLAQAGGKTLRSLRGINGGLRLR
jgi:hypothetical protein